MTELLDSEGLRIVGYFVAAAAAIVAGDRERRSGTAGGEGDWRLFWFLGAAILAFMGLAQLVGLGGIIADAGRDQARSRNWYGIRRSYQAVAVGFVTLTWGIGVLVSIWRVPERRRRYLPAAILMFTLGCFSAIRVVSLHQIDTLLFRRNIAGVRVVSVVELLLLVAITTSTIWFPFVRGSLSASGEQPDSSKFRTTLD